MKVGRALAFGLFVTFVLGFHTNPVAAPHYSGWSTPIQLPAPINSPYIEQSATHSNDGLSLYLTSSRPCGDGDVVSDLNIWVAHRTSVDAPWDDPVCLEINLDAFEDSNPNFSRDGHWMFFVSNRPGSLGAAGTSPGRDIWMSWRADVHDDHAWGEPVNAGSTLNSAVADAGPTYFENENGLPQLIFTSQRSGVFDLFVADVLGMDFSAPRPIAELNTPGLVEAGPCIRHDGLEILFFRGPTVFDIFSATRNDPADPWSAPVLVDSPVSSPFNEQAPRLSKDGQTLLFSSNRDGTLGGLDIWMATRAKVPGGR